MVGVQGNLSLYRKKERRKGEKEGRREEGREGQEGREKLTQV